MCIKCVLKKGTMGLCKIRMCATEKMQIRQKKRERGKEKLMLAVWGIIVPQVSVVYLIALFFF